MCLLFSFHKPAHERRIGQALAWARPELPLFLSLDVQPEYREHERASTTLLNAYGTARTWCRCKLPTPRTCLPRRWRWRIHTSIKHFGRERRRGGGGLGLPRVTRSVGQTVFNGQGECFWHSRGAFRRSVQEPGRFTLVEDGSERRLSDKPLGVRRGPNQAVVIVTPGACSYGRPGEREPSSIEADWRSDRLSESHHERFLRLAAANCGQSNGECVTGEAMRLARLAAEEPSPPPPRRRRPSSSRDGQVAHGSGSGAADTLARVARLVDTEYTLYVTSSRRSRPAGPTKVGCDIAAATVGPASARKWRAMSAMR